MCSKVNFDFRLTLNVRKRKHEIGQSGSRNLFFYLPSGICWRMLMMEDVQQYIPLYDRNQIFYSEIVSCCLTCQKTCQKEIADTKKLGSFLCFADGSWVISVVITTVECVPTAPRQTIPPREITVPNASIFRPHIKPTVWENIQLVSLLSISCYL